MKPLGLPLRCEPGSEDVRCLALDPHEQRSDLAKEEPTTLFIAPVAVQKDPDTGIRYKFSVEEPEVAVSPWRAACE